MTSLGSTMCVTSCRSCNARSSFCDPALIPDLHRTCMRHRRSRCPVLQELRMQRKAEHAVLTARLTRFVDGQHGRDRAGLWIDAHDALADALGHPQRAVWSVREIPRCSQLIDDHPQLEGILRADRLGRVDDRAPRTSSRPAARPGPLGQDQQGNQPPPNTASTAQLQARRACCASSADP